MRRSAECHGFLMPAAPSSRPAIELRAAFEQLARSEGAVLYRTARRLARPPTEAADLVQETLLRAYRTFENFRPGTNARAWLLTILYSVAMNDRARHGRRAEVAVGDLESNVPLSSTVRAGDEELALLRRLDMSPQVENALGELPEPFRDAVVLVDMEELTYEEAAGVLACPIGTLRSRLFRGRRHLYEALREHAYRVGLIEKR